MEIIEIIKFNLSKLTIPFSEEGIPLEPVRLIHGQGENEALRKLNIDFYPPLLLVSLYQEISQKELSELESQLDSLFPQCPLLVQDRSTRPYSVLLERGDISEEMIIHEGGLDYYLNPKRGQNPGFFTDMREGRRLISKIVKGFSDRESVKVLNLFAYTCSLSVSALAAGADKVVNIDMNKNSLEIGKRNHRLNHDHIPGGYGNQALFLGHDIYKSFGRLKREGPYELIIADPPPSQKGSFNLSRDYPKLLRRLPDMLQPGGVLLLSINSPDWTWEDFEVMIRENLPPSFQGNRIPPPMDFKPREKGRGLKLIVFHE